MKATIVYGFETGQDANRFLNRLKAGAIPDVTVRLHKGSSGVAVSYSLLGNGSGYDETCAALDRLSEEMGGRLLSEQ